MALFVLALAIGCAQGVAQGPTSNWFFSWNAAIKFENYVPHNLPNTSAMFAPYGAATISNAQGELQYYARPDSVYNRSHVLVESGGVEGFAYSWQGAMLIPHMVDPSKYFLITNDFFVNNASAPNQGYFIHEIEKTWAYPEGEIKPDKKNILFCDSAGTRLTAVHHANGRDVWVLVRIPETDTIAAYLLTAQGIQFPPVYSLSAIPDTTLCFGQLKASPKGDLLGESLFGYQLYGENTAMLHQFDRATGKASNTIVLPAFDSIPYVSGFSCEFSQSGKNFFNIAGDSGTILQYSLATYDSASIVASVYQHPPSVVSGVRNMQIGIDSKIYAVRGGSNMLRIENPDAAASQVIINVSALSVFPNGAVNGLPDFIQTFFHPAYFDYSRACSQEPLKFWSRNPNIDSLRWDFGDPASGAENTDTSANTEHLFSSTDTFGVLLTTYTNGLADTFFREIILYDAPSLSMFDSVYIGCMGQPLEVSIPLANEYMQVLWSDNIDSVHRVFNQPEVIGLIAYNFCDTVNMLVRIEFDSLPQVNLGSDVFLCSDSIVLTPNQLEGRYILWSTGDSTVSITTDSAAAYWIETGNGCDTVSDSIHVFDPIIPIGFGTNKLDTCVSPLSPLPLPISQSGLWQQVYDRLGNELVDFYNFGLDTYQIIQFGGCDTLSQTLIGSVSIAPDGEIIIQRNLCEDGGLKLEFQGEGNYSNLIWNTGQTTEIIRPIETGVYTVEIFEPPCRTRLSVNIDSFYCPDQLACMPIMPNVFSPNGDGINEYFRPTEDLSYCLEPNADLSIYNRWGVLLFYTKQIMVGWDGSVNGELSADGVYYYVFSITDKNNKRQSRTGTVMLIR